MRSCDAESSVDQVAVELGLCILVGILAVEIRRSDKCAFLFLYVSSCIFLRFELPTLAGGSYHASSVEASCVVFVEDNVSYL